MEMLMPLVPLNQKRLNATKEILESSHRAKRSETEIEKAQQTPNLAQAQAQAIASKSSAPDVVEQMMVNSYEKTSDSVPEIEKLAESEAPLPVPVDEPSDVLHDHPTTEQQQSEDVNNTANSPVVNEELSSMEDQTTKERIRRRKSPPH
ncbi:hypothetical protein KY290_029660 [Solanum tuberosum]|uniref:Integrase core domain containing protein n=1 Tax=Solanum tuberosum TaxID=4113 RepID=A0ABQ7UNE3_SOLTU|nr:hypothetical protein KY290_029660 [Solanum tuberosum]